MTLLRLAGLEWLFAGIGAGWLLAASGYLWIAIAVPFALLGSGVGLWLLAAPTSFAARRSLALAAAWVVAAGLVGLDALTDATPMAALPPTIAVTVLVLIALGFSGAALVRRRRG